VSIQTPTEQEIREAVAAADGHPDTIRHRVRLAGLLRRAGRMDQAADAYRRAARAHAVRANWLSAFALARALLHVDPADKETQRYVAALYARRESDGKQQRRDRTDTTALAGVLDGPTAPPLAERERFPLATTRADALASLPLLADLNLVDHSYIADQLRSVVVRRGEVIFREGEVSEGMFLILRGEARVTVVDDRGVRAPLTVLGEGDFFGEFSLIGCPLRTALVEAVSRVELLEIDRGLFEALTECSERFRRWIGASIRRRQKENVLSRSSVMAGLTSEQRALLAGGMGSHHVLAGELVVRQGETAGHVVLLGDGRLEVYERDETGEKIFIDSLLPGQYVPDPAVVDGGPASINARATEGSLVFTLDRQVLLDEVGDTPAKLRELRRLFAEPPLRSGAFAAVHSQPLADSDEDRR